MRILRLSFRNLNSLAGDWEVDFTHPDYVSSGIFAITGPTGAGKTTILDAICLALYGQTPRLGRITQSENEIMSRQTGDCSAEVEFETSKGHYRCHWSQHRSRKQAAGQLQAPKHEIVDVASGLILESKLTAVARKVEEVTGMDFDRFTRSMLLAQGGFAAFLQATADKRAPILEQITGTAIYSQISIKVHECTTEQRKKLEVLRLELDGMQLLAPEEQGLLLREQVEKQGQETALLASVHSLRVAQAWKERITQFEVEIGQLDQAWIDFETRKRAAAVELECLAQASRAQTIEGDYAGVAALRTQQAAERSELTVAEERLPATQLGLQAGMDALGQSELELTKVGNEQQREADLIRATRALDVKLTEAGSRLQVLQADSDVIKRQRGDQLSFIATCEQELQATGVLRGDCVTFLNKHSVDAGLAEALTGIEQQIKSLKGLDRQCTERRSMLAMHVAQRTAAEQTLQQAQTAWAASALDGSEADKRVGAIQAARDSLLLGRDLASWRMEVESLSVRQRRLENVNDALIRMEATRLRLTALEQILDTLEQQRQVLTRQEVELLRECALREDVSRQLQDKLVLLNRVRDLEEERSHLVDGTPCPLCGASQHPYAVGNVPRPDEASQELELARNAYKAASERLAGVRLELVGVSKECGQAQQAQQDSREKLALDEALCSAGFAELVLVADTTPWESLIRRELDACQLVLDTCRDVIRQADGREQELAQARAALDTAREAMNRHDKERHAAEVAFQTAVSAQKRLTLECETLQVDLDRAQIEAGQSFETYGCRDVTPSSADRLLAILICRRSDYLQRMKEQERLEKVLADLSAKKGQQQALLTALEANITTLEQRLAENQAQLDDLSVQRHELFGERNPDTEEQRLASVLARAVTNRDELLREHNRRQHERDGLQQQIQRLSNSITIRTTQLHELESALKERMTEAGFIDEAAFLLARLPQARFNELARLAETLQRDELELQTRRRDRVATLQQEQDRALSEKTLDLIREENVLAGAELSTLQKSLGAIEQQLQRHAEQQQRQLDRVQALEMLKMESARWEQLHALIGSSDGKKFRNFAQGLTFELMVAHANRQLQKMSDRYILVRDEREPLELNVIDNYQAGEIRSTKNLSGGESFIASLALSLGLSSMASRNVRVDSLFLDEGFGTLDEDALETALETLSGLQQDGKLIGIISHVPALKERIGTQIQLEAGSSGRSSLSGPGCRRL